MQRMCSSPDGMVSADDHECKSTYLTIIVPNTKMLLEMTGEGTGGNNLFELILTEAKRCRLNSVVCI